jgi:drug/metabolite transporter (DMT)-like permease
MTLSITQFCLILLVVIGLVMLIMGAVRSRSSSEHAQVAMACAALLAAVAFAVR